MPPLPIREQATLAAAKGRAKGCGYLLRVLNNLKASIVKLDRALR